jgi:tRNA(fMet)-specific endonuclease VapC
MNPAIIDTDILSEILRAIDRGIVRNGEQYLLQFERYTIKAVTLVEIISGFVRAGRQRHLDSFRAYLPDLEILPLDQESAVIAAEIYGMLERSGRTIGRADPMIAGIAIRNDLTVVTGNSRHYERIINAGFDLRIENWRR